MECPVSNKGTGRKSGQLTKRDRAAWRGTGESGSERIFVRSL